MDIPDCQADPLLLRQVYFNLLGNAIKYTRRQGSAMIKIGWLREHEQIVYFVQDNGTGFDMLYAGKLFQLFQRLHSAEEFEGTGVGLASIQRIISRHNGRIWTEAQLGKGATFFFTLGISKQPEIAQE